MPHYFLLQIVDLRYYNTKYYPLKYLHCILKIYLTLKKQVNISNFEFFQNSDIT